MRKLPTAVMFVVLPTWLCECEVKEVKLFFFGFISSWLISVVIVAIVPVSWTAVDCRCCRCKLLVSPRTTTTPHKCCEILVLQKNTKIFGQNEVQNHNTRVIVMSILNKTK
ncbi:unnamed protein product [Ceratitis capitata]|uniref:(Mediterranean fruit fly) hypothetical protein n=1 Tax=Ceratitis capitata TaxID=7213 RepID=A0A811V4B6_CERCA|nr:unnamed protein product [Ceratitis capitata]